MVGILSTIFSIMIVFILLKFASTRKRRAIAFQLCKHGGYNNEAATWRFVRFLLLTTIFFAMMSIGFGHYSRSIPEFDNNWLLIPMIFSYFYIVAVLLVVYLVSNFSMSGYR